MSDLKQTESLDIDALAKHYAKAHLATDPGIVSIYYLPEGAGAREIRFLEVNNLIGNITDAALEPFDFGIDIDTVREHRLFVLDVTPEQWNRILNGSLKLPDGWGLDGKTCFELENASKNE